MAKRSRPQTIESSESKSEHEEKHLDNMSLEEMKKFVRQTQLQKNQAEKKMRAVLGDVSNTADDDGASHSKSSRKSGKQPRKRQRLQAKSPAPSEDDTSPPRGSNESQTHDSDKSPSHVHDSDRDSEESDDAASEQKCDEEKEVALLGQRFVIEKGLWMKAKGNMIDAKLDKKYDEKKRFDGAQVQGQLRDMLSILPDRYKRKIFKERSLMRAFLRGMGTQRSNTSTRIRHHAGAAIFDCAPQDLLTPESRLAFEEIGWHGDAGRGGGYAPLDVPLLHEDYVSE
ncbi:hypothetical protein C8J57DRAFT_1718617 [Mycena rebaudengoi]|nr:hypothetical protein C8J57DRAFT_1718617 [Mycena rebaudengoi]